MTSTPSTTEQYLTTLEGELGALGPQETAEVVAEIRGLLADAVADAGDDEEAALAGVGSPEVLAARILEERGVITGPTRVPDAPTSAQVVAALIDLVIAAVAGVFVLTLVGLLASVIQYYKAPDPIVLGTIIGGMLAYWAAVAWWWTKRRTRPSYASTGMKTAVALLLAAVLLLSAAFLNELRWQGRIHEALLDASDSQQVVAAAYQQVTQGAETEQVQANFTESARADMAALQKRAAAGELDSYETHGLGLPDSPFARAMRWDHSPSHTVLVEVWEYDRVGDFTPYVYRVSEIDLPPVNGVGQSTLRIESVERKDFPSESTSGDAEAVISVF